MNTVFTYVLKMIPYMVTAIPVILLWRWLRLRRLHQKGVKTTLLHEIMLVVFCLFCVGLASQTVIPPVFYMEETGQYHILWGLGQINIIPFSNILRFLTRGSAEEIIINILGNIFMFVPIGFFIPLLFHGQTAGKTIFIGFLISLLIETCQIPVYRVSDVDDLFMNTFGAALGYGMYRLLTFVTGDFCDRFRMKAYTISKNTTD